ncbi:MAG TPA: hypothetical protein DCG01_08750, partial [Shigella sp.]|nr:hypothetical protein [Shigella sp.]
QEGQLIETEATGAPQKHHHTLNQQVGSITGVLLQHRSVWIAPRASLFVRAHRQYFLLGAIDYFCLKSLSNELTYHFIE